MLELAAVLLFFVSVAFLCLGGIAFWRASDAVWQSRVRCALLENDLANLNWRLGLLYEHVENLTNCHNRFVTDLTNSRTHPPRNDEWWKRREPPPWEAN